MLPSKVGVYNLSPVYGDPTLTFYAAKENGNYIATSGTIEIISFDTISTGSLKGRMNVFYSDSFNVSGVFKLQYNRKKWY